MASRTSVWVALSLVAFTNGCALASSESGGGEVEGVAQTSQALCTGLLCTPILIIEPFYTTHEWAQGQAPVEMKPASTHVCALTKIQGRFRGGGERVQVYVNPSTGNWRLEGSSYQHGVAASAACFRKSGFLANGTERTTSPQMTLTYGIPYASGGSQVCGSNWRLTLGGENATFLTGYAGPLRGGGEWVWVNQSSAPTTSSTLHAGLCGGELWAFAHAFFVGDSANRQAAKFYRNTEFGVGHNEFVDMAPVNDAMCYLTMVQGAFDGGGEAVEIFPAIDTNGIKRWRLQARGFSSGVSGRARCMLRDQR